jgi:hypothetical protein
MIEHRYRWSAGLSSKGTAEADLLPTLNTRGRRASCLRALALLALAALSGCGAEDAAGRENDGTVLGNLGILEFTVTPLSPPAAGPNAFHVRLIQQRLQAPLAGASLRVHAMMPSMGHEATADPHVAEIEPGLYEVTDIVFSMAGTWEVRYRAERSSLQDEAAFRYEVR